MTQAQPEHKSGYSDVDQAADPAFYVNNLREQYAHNPKLLANKERTFALAALQPGQIVLDAGCGLGRDSLLMAAAVGANGHVYGVDRSAEMVAAAQATAAQAAAGLPVTFQQGDLYQLDFAADFFDLCRSDKTFQHLDEPEKALRELVRVARPGGRIVIAEPDHDSLIIDTPHTELNRRFVDWRSRGLAQGGIGHQLYGLFKQAGLTAVGVVPLTNIYTNYEEKRVSAPYLDEIWYAQQQGVFTVAEAELWSAALQEAIAADRFFCMQTYIVTVGTKGAL